MIALRHYQPFNLCANIYRSLHGYQDVFLPASCIHRKLESGLLSLSTLVEPNIHCFSMVYCSKAENL